MDIATLIGLLGALGIVTMAILQGGSIMLFINPPSILIVFVGSIFVVLMKFPLSTFLGAFKVAMKAFLFKADKPEDLIELGIDLATTARKEGILGLEGKEIANPFLKKGVALCVDGHDPDLVKRMLSKEINLTIERHETGQNIFKALGDVGPAMGMIGTLIGLVQMLANMEDPKTIGPAMAVALLTTLYGAMLATMISLPIADKLELRSNEEKLNKSLILETITAIQEGINPKVMEDLLKTYLPEGKRGTSE